MCLFPWGQNPFARYMDLWEVISKGPICGYRFGFLTTGAPGTKILAPDAWLTPINGLSDEDMENLKKEKNKEDVLTVEHV